MSKYGWEVRELLEEWHEAGRGEFEKNNYRSLNYDTYAPKQATEKQKYWYLDEGTSGKYILDKATGDIYCIKGYGVPNKRKVCGNIATITGQRLFELRRW